MAKNIITLREAAQIIDDNTANKIDADSFGSFNDFISYYDIHYKPLLEAIENGEEIDGKRRHLLNFLASDLLKLFKDNEA